MTPPRQTIALYKKLLFSLLVFVLFFYGLDRAAKQIIERNRIQIDGKSVLPGTVVENTSHSFVVPDPTRIWILNPGETNYHRDIFINDDGFRGDELPTAPAGSKTILMLGDSCVFGWGVGRKDTIAVHLDEYLFSKDCEVEVINAGVPGYSSLQCLYHLKEICKKHRPDMVTLQIGWNDSWSTPSLTDSEIIARGPKMISFNFFARKLWVVRLASYYLSKRHYEKFQKNQTSSQSTRRVSPDDYRKNLAEIISLCRANRATPILINLPQRLPIGKPEISQYLEALPEIAKANDVPLIDLLSPMQTGLEENDRHFADEFHFSAEGSRQAAAIIGGALLEMLK